MNPALDLSPVAGLLCWPCLQPDPLTVYLHPTGPTSFSSLHCRAHVRGKTLQPQECMLTPEPLQLPEWLQLALVLLLALAPHQNVCICNLPQASVCASLQLPPLPATGPGGTAENPSITCGYC